MTRDDVIRLAQDADCLHVNLFGDQAKGIERLARFATLVVAEFLQHSGQYVTNDASRAEVVAEAVRIERQECAHGADDIAGLREAARNISPETTVKLAAGCAMDTARLIAATIRARVEKGPNA